MVVCLDFYCSVLGFFLVVCLDFFGDLLGFFWQAHPDRTGDSAAPIKNNFSGGMGVSVVHPKR